MYLKVKNHETNRNSRRDFVSLQKISITIMATTIHYPSESSTIDALWTILSQQTENVKRALSARLTDSFIESRTKCNSRTAMTDEELASVLAEYPSFDECEHQEMTDDQFHQVVRSLSGKVPQSVSKWL